MPRRKHPPLPDTQSSELWNLSPITAEWLKEFGIETHSHLASSDLFEVWIELKRRHQQVTALMYYALWGSVHNCHWNQIPDSEKAEFESRRSQVTAVAAEQPVDYRA